MILFSDEQSFELKGSSSNEPSERSVKSTSEKPGHDATNSSDTLPVEAATSNCDTKLDSFRKRDRNSESKPDDISAPSTQAHPTTKPVLKHSAESLIAKTAPPQRAAPVTLGDSVRSHEKFQLNANSINKVKPGDASSSNILHRGEGSTALYSGDNMETDSSRSDSRRSVDGHSPINCSGRTSHNNTRANMYSPDGYSADSEPESRTHGGHSHGHVSGQHARERVRQEEQLKQSHYQQLLRLESEKRDMFEKENRFLQEQKLLCKDSRSPPNVTVCQRSSLAHSLFPMCHPNLFGTNASAFHHPMASLYINTVASHPHLLSHITSSALSSLSSGANTPPSSSPPHRSPTQVNSPTSSSYIFPSSHHHQSIPSPHQAAVARALAASTLPLTHPLAFFPRNISSLGPVFQTRSPPSRYHPYAPNPVSPGVPSSPEGGVSGSSTPSPSSSPLMKVPSSGIIKPVAIPREIGLNLTTTDNRVVPV